LKTRIQTKKIKKKNFQIEKTHGVGKREHSKTEFIRGDKPKMQVLEILT